MTAPPWPSTSRGLQASFPSRSVVFIVIERLSFPCKDGGIGAGVRVKSFRISKQLLYFHSEPGASASAENFRKMNCRENIRECLLAERMLYWRSIARCPFLDKSYPEWRARKNFLAFIRKYPGLAERLRLRETDVFLIEDTRGQHR